MNGKYPVVTLCGSSKFKTDFIRMERELALKGNIVLSLGVYGHADAEYAGAITPEVKDMLDDLHKERINLSDEIFVINKDGYIGESCRNEIEYARKTGKIIRYME